MGRRKKNIIAGVKSLYAVLRLTCLKNNYTKPIVVGCIKRLMTNEDFVSELL